MRYTQYPLRNTKYGLARRLPAVFLAGLPAVSLARRVVWRACPPFTRRPLGGFVWRATYMPSTLVEKPLQIRPFMQNKPNF